MKFLGVLAFIVGSVRSGYVHLQHIKDVIDGKRFTLVEQKSTTVEATKGLKIKGKLPDELLRRK